jgi:hypothetical protein
MTTAPQPPNALSPAEAYLSAIRAIVRQEMAAWQPGCFDYTVVAAYPNNTVDLQPADTSRGMPPISGVSIWSGLPGGTVQPQVGSHLSLVLLDTRQSKPVVVGAFDSTTATLIQVAATLIQMGDQTAQPLAHASWLTDVATALTIFASAMSVLTAAPLTPIGAAGYTLLQSLNAIVPSPTTKLMGT